MITQTQIVRPFGQGELPLYGYGKGIVVEPEPGKRIVKVGVLPFLYPFSCSFRLPKLNEEDIQAYTQAFRQGIDCGNELVSVSSKYFVRNANDASVRARLEEFVSEGRKGRIVQEILGMNIAESDGIMYGYKHPELATADELSGGRVRGGFHWFSIPSNGRNGLFFGGQSLKFGKAEGLANILKDALVGTKYESGEIAGA